MSELQMINLTIFIFISHFYFIFLLFSIFGLRVRVSITLYVIVTNFYISVTITQSCVIMKIVEDSKRNDVITMCLTHIDFKHNI